MPALDSQEIQLATSVTTTTALAALATPALEDRTQQQLNRMRIATNRAAARSIKHKRIVAAMSTHSRSDLPATPEDTAPMSNLLHHSSTSQFKRRFMFGSVAHDTARANTGQHSTRHTVGFEIVIFLFPVFSSRSTQELVKFIATKSYSLI